MEEYDNITTIPVFYKLHENDKWRKGTGCIDELILEDDNIIYEIDYLWSDEDNDILIDKHTLSACIHTLFIKITIENTPNKKYEFNIPYLISFSCNNIIVSSMETFIYSLSFDGIIHDIGPENEIPDKIMVFGRIENMYSIEIPVREMRVPPTVCWLWTSNRTCIISLKDIISKNDRLVVNSYNTWMEQMNDGNWVRRFH